LGYSRFCYFSLSGFAKAKISTSSMRFAFELIKSNRYFSLFCTAVPSASKYKVVVGFTFRYFYESHGKTYFTKLPENRAINIL
jgi:hypothetical protein